MPLAGEQKIEAVPRQDEPQAPAQIYAGASLDPLAGRYQTKRCRINPDSSQIESGETVKLSIYAYSPSNEQLSFLCGDSEKIQGAGGLFQDAALCDFYGEGIIDVWMAFDGYVCASAPIWIYTPATRYNRFCSIASNSGTDISSGLSRRFEAAVFISNYKDGDTIRWKCGEREFSSLIGEIILAEEKTGFVRLFCDFETDPGYVESLPVYAGEDYCGDMLAARAQ
jgi:hypothetical protein